MSKYSSTNMHQSRQNQHIYAIKPYQNLLNNLLQLSLTCIKNGYIFYAKINLFLDYKHYMVLLHLVYYQIQLLYILMRHIIGFIFIEFACKFCICRIIYYMYFMDYFIALILKDDQMSSMYVNDINLERNIIMVPCNNIISCDISCNTDSNANNDDKKQENIQENNNNNTTDDTSTDNNTTDTSNNEINKVENISSENTNNNNSDDNKENMIEIRGRCNESGCKCDKYIENPSKWSKGKCKTCDHPPIRHKKQWVKSIENQPNSPMSPYSPKSPISKPNNENKPIEKTKEIEKESLTNNWGEIFTNKLGECINNTFGYDKESILPAKYLLHYLKKTVGFDFTGQTKHSDALKFVFVDKFGWKIVNQYGYSVRVL